MSSLMRKIASSSNKIFIRYNSMRLISSKNDTKKEEISKATEEIKKNIVIEKYPSITILNIDRPKTRNSLDEATLKEMTEAINAFDNDPEAKVLIFHGEGGSFCSGFDLDEVETKGYHTLLDSASRLLRRPLCDKITIAAVSGYAVGEGFELALACDLRILEETSIVGCLGRRFGAPQSLYGGRRLTSLIGLSRALDLLMTGRRINAQEAHAMGLAYKHTLVGTALGEAIKLGKMLIKFPQSALIMDKLAAVNSQLNPNSDESMRDEAVMQSLMGTAIKDLQDGIKKFQGGIGKHGKYYNLTEMPLKDWEIENSIQEVTVKIDEVKEIEGDKDKKS